MRFHRLIGLTGVATHETAIARRWGRHLEWPMLLVALWIPIQWYLEKKQLLPAILVSTFDWLIWLFFLGETALLTFLVRHKREYLLDNWMNAAIILSGVPILWNFTPLAGVLRDLRLLLMLALLLRAFPVLRQVLQRNQLGITLIVAIVIVLVAGALISAIDPSIKSVGDGIWYAWVTMATVGYGDVVPRNTPGRIMGGILILLGMVLFSLITANIAAFLVSSDVKKVEREESELEHRLQDIQAQLDRIERQLGIQKQQKATED